MRIAILGTRGIPNNYGGFEQLAQYLSGYLVTKKHQVWVYNSSGHPYKEKTWNGVHIIPCYDPEKIIGTTGQFIYDLNCIRHLRKLQPDIILQLGYTSSSIWHRLLPKKSVLITNMDGLEWKRSKYSSPVQRFLKYAEKLAILSSNALVADSTGIKEYLNKTYGVTPEYIAYGAVRFTSPNEHTVRTQQLEPGNYCLAIARFEPENNLEAIIKGFEKSTTDKQLVLIGNHTNNFGKTLKKKYAHVRGLLFHDPIYDINVLNNLRHYAYLYFHGHSVGGTNPSLLEAMASNALICAHDNVFNRSILKGNAWYFNTPQQITNLLNQKPEEVQRDKWKQLNADSILNEFSWERINGQYEQLMLTLLP